MFKVVSVCLLAISLLACASQKAYEGDKLPVSELATIYNSDKTVFEDGELISLIGYVGDIHVGDSIRGFPTKVQVRPGDVSLKLKFRELSFGKTVSQGLLVMGGIVSGAAAGAVNNDSEGYTELGGTVKKGKSYVIKITPASDSIHDIDIELVAKGNKE